MKYISTRGQAPVLGFEEVMLTGLASDGGLYIPESLPHFTKDEIARFASLEYAELAIEIIRPFVADFLSEEKLQEVVKETYSVFRHKAVAPLVQLDTNEWVMELFHGPTLAFKDFALQLLGRFLDESLDHRGEKAVILGATSGDTGSAAIEGCRACEHVDIFIMHPHNRVSDVQRRQMTTVLADNVHNIAIEGTFDDCQALVKASFADQAFLKGHRRLIAVNSINWARIMAQVVYYFYAALSLGAPHREVSFSVPTGNFGDIFAGYIAKRMGLPVKQLIVGTNRNDILHRFFADNSYSKEQLEPTLSPSMDIMVSSNFERLLFDLHDRDGEKLQAVMAAFDESGSISIDPARWEAVKELFGSDRSSDEEVVATIQHVANESDGYLLDPHTAIGVKAARVCHSSNEVPVVTLATAHPVKFPESIVRAGLDEPKLPEWLSDLNERPERYQVLEDNKATLHGYIQETLKL
ncbi:threonine synthase [Sansalvadorimonas sp. 2012CJ34-2]|uniref:Threonine synthase n=1 Tax=Parendozoicomonas callyspongiae TaxID=2942213 RepID=A0ABT0PFL3_9GAMM|nr:threonine synthase [Sansalvadorimonas sp. 2012CJ34-2]MCL6270169.1 threonine synthase [Sansalvadorimonas sp. 2012CJ34-2]